MTENENDRDEQDNPGRLPHKSQHTRISVLFINVNGLRSRVSKLKDSICEFPDKDIILLCETWMMDETAQHIVNQYYDVYYSNRHTYVTAPGEIPQDYFDQ